MEASENGENNPDLISAILHSCRVCMATNMKMSFIFDQSLGYSVSERVTFCTGVQITKNDGLPTRICELCLSNLQVAYSFKNMCVLSDGIFTKMVQESQVKIEPEDENSDVDYDVHKSKDILNTDRNESTIKEKYAEDKNTSPLTPDTGQRPNKHCCIVCGKSNFTTSASMRAHTRTFHPQEYQHQANRQCRRKVKENSSKCHICGGEFKRLRLHIQNVHDDPETTKMLVDLHGEKPVNCQVCGKECANEFVLEEHRQRHEKCPDCFEMFVCHHSVLKHRHKAHGLQLPSCGICGFVSVCQSKVTIHQRQVHMKEKLVKCNLCDMSFSTNSGLKKHMVSHNPVKKFKCQFCSKCFPRKTALTFHERIHTGEKSKVCAFCDAKFVQKASLNYHMMKQHPDSV